MSTFLRSYRGELLVLLREHCIQYDERYPEGVMDTSAAPFGGLVG